MQMKLFIPNMLANADAGFWFPPQGSTVAEHSDSVYFFILYVCTFFFVLIVSLMVLFMVKYRHRPGVEAEKTSTHNLTLELSWSVIPTLLTIVMFWVGFTGYIDMRTPPSDSYDINVIAKKWSWAFQYPNGWIESELHIPKGENVTLTMASDDVIHSLWVPAFRTKMDVVPGRYTQEWFKATRAGEYPLMCAEYCGQKHSNMISKVIVHETRGDFDKWLQQASDIHKNKSPVEAGEYFYKSRGCIQCHSLDGTPKNGPSFKGLYGKDEKMTDGSTVKVDDNYLRESILEPQASIVAGFRPIMPTFKGQLTDQDISAIIAFIKAQK
ncbi:MAG: cytochrome c oxidase subunit II [Gimesia sp.]|uniref:Cytochrome c oxidase subunit 2 n=3 Tax=Gimesia chilikensis TaxID=2605989 RepID=A0A517PXP6_9PLAN|nr:cytochrome c oxidase subunit II [Gimesia chilikensis]MBN72468.1 cytochrome c oxidase subunit II [Gimesia sp.]QDT24155.1 Cytochrome c oxidase subunit 2 precursor [Gimesia chilikensis]